MSINKNEYLIKVKRIYEQFSDEDGFRVLVERLCLGESAKKKQR
jgi:uncharacterized protein YeaO (DUF488 family)